MRDDVEDRVILAGVHAFQLKYDVISALIEIQVCDSNKMA